MDIKSLHYFQTIVEEGQFSKAAKKLNMTQPPLSQQIQVLETELGVQLFHRGKKIKLTEAGKLLFNRSQQILHLTNMAREEMDNFRTGAEGTVTIGTVSSANAFDLPYHLLLFRKKFPHVKIRVREGIAMQVREWLLRGIIDIGIIRTPFDLSGFNYMYTSPGPDTMSAIGLKKYRPQIQDKPIALRELRDLPLLIYPHYEEIITNACLNANFTPNIACQADSIQNLINYANMGLGIAVAPRPHERALANRKISCHDIDCPQLRTRAAIIWLDTNLLPPAAYNFIKEQNDIGIHHKPQRPIVAY
jgi:DNA-binding transcriptional LysR family regulator